MVGVPFLQPDKSEPIMDWAQRHADYARLCGGWCPIASRVLDQFGMETGLINMAARPDLIHAVMDHISEFYIEYYGRFAATARGLFDVLGFGDDFASQNTMLFSPRQWREYFLSLWKELFAIAHRNDMKAMMHSCGAIRPVIGDLIDAGLDILEVVQTRARGMDAQALKEEFGKDLVFYGGMDVQSTMPYGSSQGVQQETRRLIDIFGKDGGYILGTSHFLMEDVPYENVVTMYEEGRSYVPAYSGA
jgi:uroporphyrinogen decarboxylase